MYSGFVDVHVFVFETESDRMSEAEVFHEKQRLELCAIHALNNVLQERVFTKETADDICKR